jgi:23S rRNA pseudouridine2605 synthase
MKTNKNYKPRDPREAIDKENAPLRLNKYLAETGTCSRRKADELIEAGKVKVNGKVVTELGTKVLRSDFITVNGDPVKEIIRYVYILLNKPKDVITTTSDDLGRKTVMDIVKTSSRVYPVGRLDRNTTGTLLLTNDGELANRLMHPKYEIEKVYRTVLDRPLLPEHAEAIVKGVELEDGTTGPIELLYDSKDRTVVYVSIREGRNREVRRIFEHFDYVVKQLHRKHFATLNVSGMDKGEYRHLRTNEIRALKKLVGIRS